MLQDRVKCVKWCLKKLCASKNLIYSALLHKANTMFALLNYLVEPSLLPRRDYYRFLGGAKGNWTFKNFSHDRRNLIIEKWYKTLPNTGGACSSNLKIEDDNVAAEFRTKRYFGQNRNHLRYVYALKSFKARILGFFFGEAFKNYDLVQENFAWIIGYGMEIKSGLLASTFSKCVASTSIYI